MRHIKAEPQYVVGLYTVSHLTCQEIGDICGVTRSHIANVLKQAGITSNQGEWVDCTCEQCGKQFEKTRAVWRNSTRHYCSIKCYHESMHNPDYYANRYGQILARNVVHQYFRLQQSHVVHHEDGNTTNNDPANLKVFKNQSDHRKYHHGINHVEPLWDGSSLT